MSLVTKSYSTIVNVQNISPDVTEEKLRKIFEIYGVITSFRVMSFDPRKHAEYYANRRFAYAAFEDPDAAEEAIIELNGKEIEGATGERLRLRRTHKKYDYEPNFKKRNENLETNDSAVETICGMMNHDGPTEIVVNHLSPTVNNGELRALFNSYGSIQECHVIYRHGKSKGLGFVTFSEVAAAVRAINGMNGYKLSPENELYVTFSRGKSKSRFASVSRR